MKPEKSIAKAVPISDEPNTIDLVELLMSLLDKWYVLMLSTLVGMILFSAYAFFCIDPTYESVAKLYAVSASGDSAVDLTDLNLGTSLTNDYKELIMSYPVLDQVSELLGLNLSSEELSKLVTLTNPANTRILNITARTHDPELSAAIANTLAGVAQDYLPETMSTPRLNVAQVAKVPVKKSAPGYTKMTLLGGLLGFALIAACYIIRFIVDDTVRSQEDLESTFGIPVLTTVPEKAAVHKHHSSKETKQKEAKV